MNLTPLQRDLMLWIERYVDTHNCSPSFDDMREGAGLASKSGIHRLLTALEERGYIARQPHRSRCITILRRIGQPTHPVDALEAFLRRVRGELDEDTERKLKEMRAICDERAPV